MRILFAASEIGFGGGERILLDLASAATELGHTVACALPDGSVLRTKVANTIGPEVICYDLSEVDTVARGVDLVVANDFRSLRKVRMRAPSLAYVCHGAWQTSRKMNMWLSAVGAHVWCVSTDVLAACVRNGLVPETKAHILPYGPDPRRSTRKRLARLQSREMLGIEQDAFVAASVSRFHPVKRLPMFVDAVKRAGCVGVMGVSASFSTRAERQAYLEWRESVMAADSIIYRTDSEPWCIYTAADVIVSTSETESLGVALLEGLAAGLPAICTAAGGVQDFLLHERNALWLQGANEHEVAAAIQRLMADVDLLSNMSELAQVSVRGRSPREAMAAILRQVN